MRILILGCNGYLGAATRSYLEARGHEVVGLDNDIKDAWMYERGCAPLFRAPEREDYIYRNARRLRAEDVAGVNAVVHYAEQASAPYSMIDQHTANETVQNNIMTTHALVHAVRQGNPDCHIVKLGTMGEYGTPGVHIPEGYTEITDRGRAATMLMPKRPGSLYHTTKVMDSDLLEFAARIWDLRVTDLHQGVVYGCRTNELEQTTFYYDAIFGTALNRFIAQAVAGVPLTIYGKGGQTRGWLNILDTLRCVELAIESPPHPGTFRVLNQFTELHSVRDLAARVVDVASSMRLSSSTQHIDNPRREEEEHYYSASNDGFLALGLEPRLLTDDVIADMLERVLAHRGNINRDLIMPEVRW